MKGQGKYVMVYKINSGEVPGKLKSRGFRATSLSTYDFSTLYTTLLHNLLKEKLLDLIMRAFKKKVCFILPVTIRTRFSLLQTIDGLSIGFVKMYVTPYRIFWIVFSSDLVILVSYTDKFLVFRLVQIVLLLKPICFYFAMKEIS